MNPKYNSFSNNQFEDISNSYIKNLRKDLSDALLLTQVIENEIIKIQNDCVHTYMFKLNDPYNNRYICSKCGHETIYYDWKTK